MPWIQILVAIVSYFASRKSGASPAKSAAIAAAAGLATNWVMQETEWGKTSLAPINGTIDGWFGISNGTVASNGVVTDGSGKTVTGPAGTAPVAQPDGSVVWVPSSSSGIVNAASDVLKSWGPTGTAAVVGTTALVSSDSSKKWLPWVGGGLALVLLTR